MALAAGRLRHRIEIQCKHEARDPKSGDTIISWRTFVVPGSLDGKVWADVYHLSANERIAAQAKHSEVTARITIRHFDGLLPTMRVCFRGKIYNPEGWVPDMDSGLEYVTASCTEGMNSGR